MTKSPTSSADECKDGEEARPPRRWHQCRLLPRDPDASSLSIAEIRKKFQISDSVEIFTHGKITDPVGEDEAVVSYHHLRLGMELPVDDGFCALLSRWGLPLSQVHVGLMIALRRLCTICRIYGIDLQTDDTHRILFLSKTTSRQGKFFSYNWRNQSRCLTEFPTAYGEWATPCYRVRNWQQSNQYHISPTLAGSVRSITPLADAEAEKRLEAFFNLSEKLRRVSYPESYVQWKFLKDLNRQSVPLMVAPLTEYVLPFSSRGLSISEDDLPVDPKAHTSASIRIGDFMTSHNEGTTSRRSPSVSTFRQDPFQPKPTKLVSKPSPSFAVPQGVKKEATGETESPEVVSGVSATSDNDNIDSTSSYAATVNMEFPELAHLKKTEPRSGLPIVDPVVTATEEAAVVELVAGERRRSSPATQSMPPFGRSPVVASLVDDGKGTTSSLGKRKSFEPGPTDFSLSTSNESFVDIICPAPSVPFMGYTFIGSGTRAETEESTATERNRTEISFSVADGRSTPHHSVSSVGMPLPRSDIDAPEDCLLGGCNPFITSSVSGDGSPITIHDSTIRSEAVARAMLHQGMIIFNQDRYLNVTNRIQMLNIMSQNFAQLGASLARLDDLSDPSATRCERELVEERDYLREQIVRLQSALLQKDRDTQGLERELKGAQTQGDTTHQEKKMGAATTGEIQQENWLLERLLKKKEDELRHTQCRLEKIQQQLVDITSSYQRLREAYLRLSGGSNLPPGL